MDFPAHLLLLPVDFEVGLDFHVLYPPTNYWFCQYLIITCNLVHALKTLLPAMQSGHRLQESPERQFQYRERDIYIIHMYIDTCIVCISHINTPRITQITPFYWICLVCTCQSPRGWGPNPECPRTSYAVANTYSYYKYYIYRDDYTINGQPISQSLYMYTQFEHNIYISPYQPNYACGVPGDGIRAENWVCSQARGFGVRPLRAAPWQHFGQAEQIITISLTDFNQHSIFALLAVVQEDFWNSPPTSIVWLFEKGVP